MSDHDLHLSLRAVDLRPVGSRQLGGLEETRRGLDRGNLGESLAAPGRGAKLLERRALTSTRDSSDPTSYCSVDRRAQPVAQLFNVIAQNGTGDCRVPGPIG